VQEIPADAAAGALRSLLRASHLLSADRLAPVAAEHARAFGVDDLILYLLDYEQSRLLPLQGPGVAEREELPVDGSLAGLAFRRVQVTRGATEDGRERLWVPLLDGVERVGVAEFVTGALTPALEEGVADLAGLLAELIISMDAYTDLFARHRRRRPLTIAAEIQWDLLPPLTFASERVVITGALEPAHEIGGDTFDYAVNGDTADLLVLDAIGHGLPAALLAAGAVGAYRHGRRESRTLPATATEMDAVIAEQFGEERFATAVLARIDLASGRLWWVNAGHPPPLILRGGSLVRAPDCPPDPPLGLLTGPPGVCEAQLEPGDRLLIHTDGIVEARSPDGAFFGEERLADFVLRAAASGDPAPEILRRLMRDVLAHQAGRLQDDASIVLLEWRTVDEREPLQV
jgi:serine phosphatase RsbU (regulator of sigma subunit)